MAKAAAVVEEKPTKKAKAKSADSKNGKVVVTKAEAPKTKVAKSKEKATVKKNPFNHEGPSARDIVTRVLVSGAPRAEVKNLAKAIAKEERLDLSFKTFDVGFWIKELEKKGYTKKEGKDGNIKMTAPKAEKAAKS